MSPRVVLVLLAACGANPEAPGADDGRHEVIRGELARPDDFPATLFLKGKCTGAKVGPNHVLTAAHCVYDASSQGVDAAYASGKTLSVESNLPSVGRRAAVVRETLVNPEWLSGCAETLCGATSVTGLLDAADVAVVVFEHGLEGIPSAAIDSGQVQTGDRVTLVGFGCKNGVRVSRDGSSGALLFGAAAVVEGAAVIHPGSFVKEADIPRVSQTYFFTAGPGRGGEHAGLCPGDSGGPVYRVSSEGPKVIGVNSNYTMKKGAEDELGLPITNWHTRIGEGTRHNVGAWIRDAIGR